MSLRLGVDLDGTLADLSGAYADTARRLFGGEAVTDAPPPESPDPTDTSDTPTAPSDADRLRDARESSARRSAIWRVMLDTPDFWTTLAPIEPGIIAQLSDLSRARGWEVFFVTQRPKSAGAPVQRQSQEWLAAQGFVAPSVLTLRGGRGMVARTLELDVLVDDLAKNCVDVVAESECRPLLVSRTPDDVTDAAAARLKIQVVRSVAEALTILTAPPAPPLGRMARAMKALRLG